MSSIESASESRPRHPRWALPGHHVVRYVAHAALFVPFYLVLDWASYIEPLGSFNITPWNPGPALAIVWMMQAGLAKAPVVLAATYIADGVVRDLPGNYAITLLSALTLTAGYTLIAAILRSLFPLQRAPGTIRGLTLLVGIVAAGAAINGAAFLSVLGIGGMLSHDVLAAGWVRFWIGDVVGILVTAPLLLIAADRDQRKTLAGLFRRAETYLQTGLVVVTLWLILEGLAPDPSHGFFLLFPPLIWIALRSGLAGALVAISIVQLGIVIAFHQQAEPPLPIIELQALVATLTLTGLYLGVMVDERQRAMERLNESLHLAAAGEMAGAITHEVSQPLTALASYSRSAKLLIEAGRGDPELAALVDKIFNESLRASRVVRRLREFFRAGSMRLHPLTPGELLEMIGRIGREITQGTGVSFAASAEPDLPSLLVDRLQIELVLRNLIGNAVDSLEGYAPGRGRIDVAVKRERGKRLCVVVADNGPGIPANTRDQLFRPFASGKPNGMGLGLAVSRAIAEAHGGSLTAGAAGHGEFHFVLPLEGTRG